MGLVDESGNIVVKYKYDAYGNRISITDTSGCDLGNVNPFRYKEYYYDDDVEMYYCKSRFYVPSWHRWLNSDNISYLEPKNITSLNLFTYCNNNPVMYVDENGNMPQWAKWLIGGTIIVAAAALTIITAGSFAAAGTAIASVFTASMAPSAISAVCAGAFVGSLTIGGVGMAIGGLSGDDVWSLNNAANIFMIG